MKRTIYFDAEKHRYTDEDNNVYTSVTTKIGKVCPKFNTKVEAQKYAERHGNTADYWIQHWADITKVAIDNGNEKHDFLETSIDRITNVNKIISGTSYTVSDISNCIKRFSVSAEEIRCSPLKYMFPKVWGRIVWYLERGFKIFTERIVYWYEYLIAGKIDLLLIKGKEFVIIDWKTNKDELKFESGYYKKHNGIRTDIWVEKDERLYAPLSHLQYCKGIVYSLQLSLYAHLVELHGYTLIGLELFHLRNNTETKYDIKYMKKDVIALCNMKETIKKQKFGL